MIAGRCMFAPREPIREGARVTVSDYEQTWLGKELKGVVERVFSNGEAFVRWDNGHKDRRWPVNALIPLKASP